MEKTSNMDRPILEIMVTFFDCIEFFTHRNEFQLVAFTFKYFDKSTDGFLIVGGKT